MRMFQANLHGALLHFRLAYPQALGQRASNPLSPARLSQL
jgi:hypothetical protein